MIGLIPVMLAAAAMGRLEPVTRERPVYPAEAKENAISGLVRLRVHVTAEGKVSEVRPLSGHPLLIAAAREAVSRWTYNAMESGGVVDVDLNFQLAAEAHPAAGTPAGKPRLRLMSHVNPEYPPEAKSRRIEGTVKLLATINKEGKVARLHVQDGDPLLVEAAVAAVRQWQYEPAMLNGRPVDVVTEIDLNFQLEK